MRVLDTSKFKVLDVIFPINLTAATNGILLYDGLENTVANINQLNTDNQAAGILTFTYWISDERMNRHNIVNSTRAANVAATNQENFLITPDQQLYVDLSNAGYPAVATVGVFGYIYNIE